MVKMRTEGRVENRAVYVAVGIILERRKEVLGRWSASSEGAKFWLQVLTELCNRGLQDIFIACMDGLKGFAQAIEAVYPQTTVQLCLVHMVRASLQYVHWQGAHGGGAGSEGHLRRTAAAAEARLAEFAARWDGKYAPISALWRRNWLGLISFFEFPAEIGKIIYTTNTIESLNMSLRTAVTIRGAFPTEEAALKVLHLALQKLAQK